MKYLIGTLLELEQYQCPKCGRSVFINKTDAEAMKKENFLPDCPFECWSATQHVNTLRTEVKKIISTDKSNEKFINDHCELTECKNRPHCIEVGRTCAAISRVNAR